MITAEHAKESLCRSYVIAVASAARQNLWLGGEFDYGVDGIFKLVEPRGKRLRETGFAIDFQAKTTVKWSIGSGQVIYDLEAKAFNDLAERAGQTASTPFFLVLMCLPADEKTWSNFASDCLTVRNCAYFLQIRSQLTKNKGTTRIEIPVGNALTPESLTKLLKGVKDGSIQP